MFSVLEWFGFGENVMRLNKMLYLVPKSAILTNADRSVFFQLQRGTRQGCCLSPLLFDLALEPLAIYLRTDSEIRGMPCGKVEVKLSLYADDLVLFLTLWRVRSHWCDQSWLVPEAYDHTGVIRKFSASRYQLLNSNHAEPDRMRWALVILSQIFSVFNHIMLILGFRHLKNTSKTYIYSL